jgi:chitinase
MIALNGANPKRILEKTNRKMKNSLYISTLVLLTGLFACSGNKSKQPETGMVQAKVIVAYVTSWSQTIPEPAYMTHINYAFGHVNDTFNGIRIDNEERLKQIVALKEQHPSLKILLSIGGWGSGRFSEMAADEQYREQFAEDCLRVVNDFQLDGIDIDWEYPTSSLAEISSSPDDTNNFTLLMKDIRESIGKDKLLTLASAASAEFINFKAIDPYIDFVNIMAYDMASAPLHHSALYKSENSGENTSHDAVSKHHSNGVPYHKLVLGMPFYGRGGKGGISSFIDYKEIEQLSGYEMQWDGEAQVPYLTDSTGTFVCGYENPRSLTIKCQYIKENALLGAMYWDYDGDNETGDLRKAVYETIMK